MYRVKFLCRHGKVYTWAGDVKDLATAERKAKRDLKKAENLIYTHIDEIRSQRVEQ